MIEGRIRKFGPVVLTAQWNRVTPIISTRFGAIEGGGEARRSSSTRRPASARNGEKQRVTRKRWIVVIFG